MSTLDIITNKHVIAINQDPLGTPGYRLWKKDDTSGGSIQLWKGNLSNGCALFVFSGTMHAAYDIMKYLRNVGRQFHTGRAVPHI